jgi:ABC-type sugar transport system ATPase subunit
MSPEQPIIEMEGVEKQFGRVRALGGVDFDVRENEIVGLVGDNGAGKSTLIKTLVGIHDPDEGTIRIRGEQVSPSNPKEAQEYGIATVYQDLALVDELTVPANVFLGRSKKRRLAGLLPIVDWGGMRAEADRILKERLDFEVPTDSRAEFLSGGERQAVAIARAIATDPEIVILDEPTAALSVDAADRVVDIIKSLRDEGMSVIVISHSLEEVFSLTDRITVLHAGQTVATVDSATVTEDDILQMMISGNRRLETADAT